MHLRHALLAKPHPSDVRFIDTQAKRGGGHEDLHIAFEECLLHLGSLLRCLPGGVNADLYTNASTHRRQSSENMA